MRTRGDAGARQIAEAACADHGFTAPPSRRAIGGRFKRVHGRATRCGAEDARRVADPAWWRDERGLSAARKLIQHNARVPMLSPLSWRPKSRVCGNPGNPW